MAEKERTGMIIPFDVRRCLHRLTDAEQAKLFRAILDYGMGASLPEFDNCLGIAWDFIKPMIDRARNEGK